MSATTVLGVAPDRRPIELLELRNGHGWSPSIWRRLLLVNGMSEDWILDDAGLILLWKAIESLPEWQQAPLVLTFDTGVIPFWGYEWAAEMLDEFDRRLPAPRDHVNHVPAVADLLRAGPEAPFVGVWVSSVSDNPFNPWDSDNDKPGSGIPIGEMYLLEQHRSKEEVT